MNLAMSPPPWDTVRPPPDSSRRWRGIACALAVHALLAWACLAGYRFQADPAATFGPASGPVIEATVIDLSGQGQMEATGQAEEAGAGRQQARVAAALPAPQRQAQAGRDSAASASPEGHRPRQAAALKPARVAKLSAEQTPAGPQEDAAHSPPADDGTHGAAQGATHDAAQSVTHGTAHGAANGTAHGGAQAPGQPGAGPLPGAASRTGSDVFTLAEVERKPKLVRQVEPAYPEAARKRGLTGKVMLRIVVDEQGAVHSPSIAASDPSGVFDQCVLDAVVRWRFEPAKREGRCVAVVVMVPVRFDLASR